MKEPGKRPWSVGTVVTLGLLLLVIAGCIYVFPKLSSGNHADISIMIQQIKDTNQ